MLLRPRFAVAAILLLYGCGSEPSGGPPEIQVGLEECGYCRMIISEEKFAAAMVDEAGTAIRFDDVGCLVDHLRQQIAAPKEIWVHDNAAGGWIAAEPSWFVRDSRGTTPMGSGLLAFASRHEAEAYANSHGTIVMEWAALFEQAVGERDPKHGQRSQAATRNPR